MFMSVHSRPQSGDHQKTKHVGRLVRQSSTQQQPERYSGDQEAVAGSSSSSLALMNHVINGR